MKEDDEVLDRDYMNTVIKKRLDIQKQLVKLCEEVESNIGKGSRRMQSFNEALYIGLHNSIQDLDDNMRKAELIYIRNFISEEV